MGAEEKDLFGGRLAPCAVSAGCWSIAYLGLQQRALEENQRLPFELVDELA